MIDNFAMVVGGVLVVAGALFLIYATIIVMRFGINPKSVIDDYEFFKETLAQKKRKKLELKSRKIKSADEMLFDIKIEEDSKLHFYDGIEDGVEDGKEGENK